VPGPSRLRHTPTGRTGSRKITQFRLNVYVEGRRVDAYVYGRICETVFGHEVPKPYRLIRADEIAQGGGKTVVKAEYQRLLTAGLLSSKASTTLFLLDKDLDDIENKLIKSPHVQYTPTYDLEGLVFKNGDLADAVAAALSMDRVHVRSVLGSSSTWCDQASSKWREWVVLCLIARQLPRMTAVNYKNVSTVNNPLHDNHKPALSKIAQKTLAAASGLTPQQFSIIRRNVRRRILRCAKRGRLDRFFKGKWYANILDSEVHARFPTEYGGIRAFPDHITSLLMQSIDCTDAWAKPYRDRIQSLNSTVIP
jgi:hypothetical protein